MSQLLTQIQDSQNKVNSLTDARYFHVPETASSGASHVPIPPGATSFGTQKNFFGGYKKHSFKYKKLFSGNKVFFQFFSFFFVFFVLGERRVFFCFCFFIF